MILLCFLESNAQQDEKKYWVQLDGIGDVIDIQPLWVDSVLLEGFNKKTIQRLRNKGYWSASIESIDLQRDSVLVDFYVGRQFEYVLVEYVLGDSVVKWTQQFLNKKNEKSSRASIQYSLDQELNYYENRGYPFASIEVVESIVMGDSILVKAELDRGVKIVYGELRVLPQKTLSTKFLSSYLSVKNGEVYKEKTIDDIPDQLSNLTFLKWNSTNISYQLKRADLVLEVEKRKVNYFDGLLGMVPKEDNEGVEITGELNLSLQNLFKSAKALEFHWQRINPQSQKLNMSYSHPIIFNTPLDLTMSFDQLRQDTLFANRSFYAKLEYRPLPRSKLYISYENKLGTSLAAALEELGNFQLDYYGIGYKLNHTDDPIHPRKGIQLIATGEIGFKEVTDPVQIVPPSTQYRLSGELHHYFHIDDRSTIASSFYGGFLFNKYLYLNDLFRLGGLRTVRGFDEDEFFASEYLSGSLEWRFYLDPKSYFLLFYDQAYTSYNILAGSFSDAPAGIGLGLQMVTDGGNFRILYGLGRRRGEAFSFDNSKIHFGYTALF